MARETAAIEINKFNAGLVTDASPLTSPDNSSLAEENFVLNSDGSRNRRWGMDYEPNAVIINTTIPQGAYTVAHTSFKWKNAGGDPSRNISVVQFGNEIKFFDLSSRPISKNLLYTYVFQSSGLTKKFSFANVDGFLVIVTQEKMPYVFSITGNTITQTTQTLLIRDLFGVEDRDGSLDLMNGVGLQRRPTVRTDNHIYNLRNQSFGVPRAFEQDEGVLQDPISRFYEASAGKFPSNSDNVVQALYADPNVTPNRTLERFFAIDLVRNPLGSSRSANGYFIIDALERGASRIANDAANRVTYPTLANAVSVLPIDRTPGGPSVVSEYAGRAWYGGFVGEVIGGDKSSPRMSSYILFSKLVRNISDISLCYQEGDPTSREAPDLLDTDGGYIRLNEAYGINRLENLGDVLIIMAQNGIWKVSGTSENGFNATNFIVEKVSDRGCINPSSAVVVDNTIFYWSEDGIYHLNSDGASWNSGSISVDRIQRLFESVNEEDKINVVGSYDSFERKVRWVFGNGLIKADQTKELVLDLLLKAFYTNRIMNVTDKLPKVVSVFQSLPFEINYINDIVTVGGEPVTVGGEQVSILNQIRTDVVRGELNYVVVTNTTGTISYTFSGYTDDEFVEWKSYNGVGVDAAAFLITGYLSGTDFQRSKQVPYLSIHLRRTETGLAEESGLLVSYRPSSCIVQAQWAWSNSPASGKWGRPFQAYRYKRDYIPQNLPDNYDTGFSTIVTRNKLRGMGKVLSLKFNTEPKKDLHLYGWSMIFSVAGNV